jgi:hypothetical protein
VTQGIILLLVVIWIGARQLQARKLKVQSLWILPALMLFASFQVIGKEISATAWAPILFAFAFVVGALFGILRGRWTKVTVNQETGEAWVKGSPVGLIAWIVLLALKFAVRSVFHGTDVTSADLATSALLVMGLGTAVFRRVYIYLAYRRQAGRAIG